MQANLIGQPNANLQPILTGVVRNMGGTIWRVPMQHCDGLYDCQGFLLMADPVQSFCALVEFCRR